MSATRTPAVFIHGLWLHASAGSHARTVPRVRLRPDRPGLAERRRTPWRRPGAPRVGGEHAIDDVVEHYAAIIATLPAPPVDHRALVRRAVHREAAGQASARPRWPSTPPRSRVCCRCRWPSCGRSLPALANPANCTVGRADGAASSDTVSATRSTERSPTSCTRSGRSRRRPGRCSRPRPRTSCCTRRRRWTRRTRAAGRCCWSPAAATTPCRTWSPARTLSSTAIGRGHRAAAVRDPRPLADHR